VDGGYVRLSSGHSHARDLRVTLTACSRWAPADEPPRPATAKWTTWSRISRWATLGGRDCLPKPWRGPLDYWPRHPTRGRCHPGGRPTRCLTL